MFQLGMAVVWICLNCQCMVKLPKIIYESTAAYHGAFMKKYSGDWEMN